MNIFYRSLTIAALIAFSHFAVADELVLTSSEAKRGGVYSLDFSTGGQATAFQFEISLPKGVSEEQVDLSKCLSELPKTHQGSCTLNKDKIIGFAFSGSNELLPEGISSIGRVSISGAAKGLHVSQFLVSDVNARAIEASVISDVSVK